VSGTHYAHSKQEAGMTNRYTELLEQSYEIQKKYLGVESKSEFLGDYIFNFYGTSDFLVRKAVGVCAAITNHSTFEYIGKSEEDHLWYISMVNMPFFKDKIEWGTSIRGAWWTHSGDVFRLENIGLWSADEEQILYLELNRAEWEEFMNALVEFVGYECSTPKP
jgi:hypothetical protein